MIGLEEKVKRITDRQIDMLGNASTQRAVTATLHVSPDGSGTDGLSWATAYQTIQDALDAASTDANDCTLILIAPHDTYYDIDTAGDPTWTGNYELVGTHRLWSVVRNTNVGATSILKLTGKASLNHLVFVQTDTLNGIILTKSGYRVKQCAFSSSGLTGAATSIHIDGSAATIIGGLLENIEINGHVTHSTGIYFDTATTCDNQAVHIHTCLTGIQIVNAASDKNNFEFSDIGDCALAIDIDGGNEQHFANITFHHNTRNIDDEVGDHTYVNIFGEFNIYLYPANMTGTNVLTGAAVTYGLDTELVAANAIDNPFRIVGVNFEPDDTDLYQVRFTSTGAAPYYDEIQFEGVRREGQAAASGTEHVFNADTRISCSARNRSGTDNTLVWLEIQEI
jgi:hypothetical protein